MKRLTDRLTELSEGSTYPFHMPGHKRNVGLMGTLLPYGIDITEITGFDNLHSADGIIDDIQSRLCSFYKAKKSFLLVNGSTCGILASILSVCDFGDSIAVSRNCHKSVHKAIELYNLRAEWISPEVDLSTGISGEISPDTVLSALNKSNAKVVVITSPTYEGVISNIPQIAKVCHENGALLIVDMAHGAHLPLMGGFDNAYGADIAVVSLHKTLPCLTQTACLNVYSDKIDIARLANSLSAFETSSPSYPLMASVDRCMTLIEKKGVELADKYKSLLSDFYDRTFRLKALRIYRTDDYGKLIIACDKASISGSELFARLRDSYAIECEMASARYVVAMTSICDTREGFDKLIDALFDIDKELTRQQKLPLTLCGVPKVCMTAYEAVRREKESVEPEKARGRISAEYVFAYPPGIPLLAPGEEISDGILSGIAELEAAGVAVTYGSENRSICVINNSKTHW